MNYYNINFLINFELIYYYYYYKFIFYEKKLIFSIK